jgi:hypothetical protein
MHTLQEILKFRDSSQFRSVVDSIAVKIADIPWEITPEDEGVTRAIASQPDMSYTSFVRRTVLDLLALNFATFEVVTTENDKFLLMQCFPAELYPTKAWNKDSPKDEFRWVYFNRQEDQKMGLSDQKVAIFPSYGNFDITGAEMNGLPSPVNQIMEAIAFKLGLDERIPNVTPQYLEMGFTHIFDASLSIQKALDEISEPESGYASLWNSQFPKQKITKLSSGIIVPPEKQLVLGKGNGIVSQGYSEWIAEVILKTLLYIYQPLLKGGEQEEVVKQSIGDCNGFEDMISAIALIFAQGINRLMRNLDIECEFKFVKKPLSEQHELEHLIEGRQKMAALGYSLEENF